MKLQAVLVAGLRGPRSGLTAAWTSLAAVVLALIASAVVIALAGASPVDALRAMVAGAFGGPQRIGGTLAKMVPLVLAALGWMVAFSAGRINIGLEGQILAGGVLAATVGLLLGPMPQVLHVSLAVTAGMAGGALWAGIAALLWARRGVNEIIATLMLNFVAIQGVAWLVRGPLSEPTRTLAQTQPVAPTARWPTLWPGTALHWDLVLVLLLAVGTLVLLTRTTVGMRMRIVGTNPRAGLLAGLSPKRLGAVALMLSGALGGIAGSSQIIAQRAGTMTDEFSAGYGFDGIVVALVARNHPLAAVPAALLFAALRQGGGLMEARVGVPASLVLITQGTVILLVAASGILLERRRQMRVDVDAGAGAADAPSGHMQKGGA